ncbi:MAG: YhfC family intramembrane metalloprotease [Hominenteromicrobium sp.]
MMETVSISAAVLVTLSLELLFSLALPIGAIVIWKKKTDVSLVPFGIGAAAFFVFSMVLEQLVHFLVLGLNASVSDFLLSRPWLYAIYGGFVAGLFEETARFLVFKTMMQKNIGRENAITYGLGHGGLECFLILGMTMISNLLISAMFNSMGAEAFIAQYTPDQTDAVVQAIEQINAIDPVAAILACVERACSLVLQVELSVLVFASVRLDKFWLYPVSILLHMGIDFFAALYQTGTLPSIYLLEGLLAVYVAALFFVVRRVYNKLPAEQPRALDRFGRPI